jgi:hypothetical protein
VSEGKLPAVPQEFRIFTSNLDELNAMLDDNLGGTLTLRDFRRIPIPAAGSTIWKIPDVNAKQGYVNTEEISGIIIYHHPIRTFWRTPYSGGKEPPSCYSADGKHGIGDPGGLCASCQYNQFHTVVRSGGKEGKGKACAEKDQLFILRPQSILPIIINVPPSSLDIARMFFRDLLEVGIPYWTAVVSLTLTEAKSDDGIVYSKLKFHKIGEVPAQFQPHVAAYREVVKEMVKAATIVAEDYTTEEK